ncbi:MAG: hypothetical protein K1X94_19310 [Sandaracinaceae bacterium]|nr:hypothetical protein [Sandaracinaceae bacterium]
MIEALSRVEAAPLRAAGATRVRDWLARSLEALSREAHVRGQPEASRVSTEAPLDTRHAPLDPSTLGSLLSPEVLRDAIETSCEVRGELAAAQAQLAGRAPVGRVGLVLPGNVETAIVRPLVWALLARDAVAIRVSSRHAGIAPRLHAQLLAHDAELSRAVAVLRTAREDHDALRALSRWADRLHVWGSDATVAELARLTDRELMAHGTGLSLALVTREAAARADRLDDALARLALDVARYDQRGCLSPQVCLVEEGGAIEPSRWARGLHTALEALGPRFPRGAITPEERAAERLHRDAALAIGAELWVGADHAVSLERGAIRRCPTVRNLAVHVMSRAEIVGLAARLGPQLKSVGVLDDADVAPVSAWLGTRAHVVPFGRMQTPSLLAPADGAPPWHGLVA